MGGPRRGDYEPTPLLLPLPCTGSSAESGGGGGEAASACYVTRSTCIPARTGLRGPAALITFRLVFLLKHSSETKHTESCTVSQSVIISSFTSHAPIVAIVNLLRPRFFACFSVFLTYIFLLLPCLPCSSSSLVSFISLASDHNIKVGTIRKIVRVHYS